MNRIVRPLMLLVGLPLLMASALAVISLAQVGQAPAEGSDAAALESPGRTKDIFSETQKFTEIYQYIRKMYFRPIDEKVLLNGAIEGLLQTVDRNDSFIPDSKILLGDEDPLENRKSGVGIVLGFTSLRNYGASVPVILAVIPGSPADLAGVRPESVLWQVGDRAVVNGELLARNLYDLLDHPPAGKKTEIVLYDPVDGRREISLIPGAVQLPRDLKSENIESGVLQVQLPTLLTSRTVEELAALLDTHAKTLQKGLILDLRESCLGDPQLGYRIADLFIRDGAVLGKVLVERAEKKLLPKRDSRGGEMVFRAEDGRALLDFPLVALVDFTTAGPAEVLAGALKYAGRGRIVGAKTFGYAALRERFVFERGAQITLTTGLLATGGDKVYMGEGLEPDVKIETPENTDLLAAALEDEPEEVPSEETGEPRDAEVADLPEEPAATKPEQPDTDTLLDAAVKEVLKLRAPGKAEAVQPAQDKPSKDIG